MPNYDDLFTGQPAQQEDPSFDKEAWAAKKQAERESVYAMIDDHVHDMGVDGGVFQGYLDVQARFDLYSVSNAILIAAQCPEAPGWPTSTVGRPAACMSGGVRRPSPSWNPARSTPVRKMAPPACSAM